jgi:hypothetical protein
VYGAGRAWIELKLFPAGSLSIACLLEAHSFLLQSKHAIWIGIILVGNTESFRVFDIVFARRCFLGNLIRIEALASLGCLQSFHKFPQLVKMPLNFPIEYVNGGESLAVKALILVSALHENAAIYLDVCVKTATLGICVHRILIFRSCGRRRERRPV